MQAQDALAAGLAALELALEVPPQVAPRERLRVGRFDVERYNGRWRGGFPDNDNVSSTGVIPIPAGLSDFPLSIPA